MTRSVPLSLAERCLACEKSQLYGVSFPLETIAVLVIIVK
jgi:hypothetical protein